MKACGTSDHCSDQKSRCTAHNSQWLFPGVLTLVLPQMISLGARIVTLVTPESLFSSVCELVPLEINSLGARIVTLVTFEGLLS